MTAPLIGATHAGLPSPPITEPAYHNIQYMAANSAIPYIFPNIETVAHLLAKAPLRWSWIRSPGRMQNTFANESFVDELAAFVGISRPNWQVSDLLWPVLMSTRRRFRTSQPLRPHAQLHMRIAGHAI